MDRRIEAATEASHKACPNCQPYTPNTSCQSCENSRYNTSKFTKCTLHVSHVFACNELFLCSVPFWCNAFSPTSRLVRCSYLHLLSLCVDTCPWKTRQSTLFRLSKVCMLVLLLQKLNVSCSFATKRATFAQKNNTCVSTFLLVKFKATPWERMLQHNKKPTKFGEHGISWTTLRCSVIHGTGFTLRTRRGIQMRQQKPRCRRLLSKLCLAQE